MTAHYIRRSLAAGRRPGDFHSHRFTPVHHVSRPHTALFSISRLELGIMIALLILTLAVICFYIRRTYKAGSKYVRDKMAGYENTRSNIGKAARMNIDAGNVLKVFFGKSTEVAEKVPVPKIPVPKGKLPFVKGADADRARENEGERRALFDKRYGWVNSLGESSRFDGAGSVRADSVVTINEEGPIHREDCVGYCGTNLVRKRSM